MEWKVYSDGGYRMAQDRGSWSFVVLCDGKEVNHGSGLVLNSTSNQCEAIGIINGLRAVKEYTRVVECHSDSQLLVRQLNGQYQVRNEKLKRLHSVIEVLVGEFEKVSFVWNGRDSNPWSQRCDRLCDIQLETFNNIS